MSKDACLIQIPYINYYHAMHTISIYIKEVTKSNKMYSDGTATDIVAL
jgi:hypothetical protein